MAEAQALRCLVLNRGILGLSWPLCSYLGKLATSIRPIAPQRVHFEYSQYHDCGPGSPWSNLQWWPNMRQRNLFMYLTGSSHPNSMERNWKPTEPREMSADSLSPVASHPAERYRRQVERRGSAPVGLVGLGRRKNQGGKNSRCQFLFKGFHRVILVFD